MRNKFASIATDNGFICEAKSGRVLFGQYAGRRSVAKIFESDEIHRFQSEITGAKFLRILGMKVPEIFDEVITNDGALIFFERLEGKTLADQNIKTMDSDIIFNIAQNISKQLVITCRPADKSKKALYESLNRTIARIKTSPELRDLVNLKARNKLNELISTATPPKFQSYVTLDWRLRHLFFLEKQFSGYIDFEYCQFYDPNIEIAHFLNDLLLQNCRQELLLDFCTYLYSQPQMRMLLDPSTLRLLSLKQSLECALAYEKAELYDLRNDNIDLFKTNLSKPFLPLFS